MNKIAISLLAGLAIIAGSVRAGDDKTAEKSYSRSEIDSLINLPESYARQEAANSILNAVDFDTTWAFKTIIKGLVTEEVYLKDSDSKHRGYVWTSWENIQRYVRDLAKLGALSPESLIEFGEYLSANQETWVTIALGYYGNGNIHNKLMGILSENDNILQKAMAIEALLQNQDTTNVRFLIGLWIQEENSISWAAKGCITGFNPIGLTLGKSFWDMGFILDWDGEKYVLKKKEDVKTKYPKPDPGDQNE